MSTEIFRPHSRRRCMIHRLGGGFGPTNGLSTAVHARSAMDLRGGKNRYRRYGLSQATMLKDRFIRGVCLDYA